MKKNLKLVMFDWDGTLCDSMAKNYEVVLSIFEQKAPGIKPPSIREYGNEMTSEWWKFYHRYGVPETVSADEISRVRNAFLAQSELKSELMPKAKKLLRECKKLGLSTAIISASSEAPARFEKRLAGYGLLPLVDRVRLRACPKSEGLVETLDFFGVKAENSIFCDDIQEALLEAKNLGLITVGITFGYNSRSRIMEARPDHVADSMPDVLKIIQRRCKQ